MKHEQRLEPTQAAQVLNSMPCPVDCPIQNGAFQIQRTPEHIKVSCYTCSMNVDIDTVKIVYSTDEGLS